MLQVGKNPPANAGDVRKAGSIPWSGRSPGEGHGNPLAMYSCLENPTDGGACPATARRVTKSFQIQLKQLSTQRFFSFGFTANLRGMYRDFSHASCSLEGMTSPTINIPHHSGELVTTDEPILTHHYNLILWSCSIYYAE